MPITYNAWRNCDHIYTDDGGVWSGNLAALAIFDYFPNAAAVNDAIYFGHFWQFDDIRVYVGTAFNATSVTFAWEYWTGAAWVALTVVDGTANWTNLNQQTVTFVPPDDWRSRWIFADGGPDVYERFIRCRITAIAAPVEGGANSTELCQCGDNIARITAYTLGVPCNFTDLYNADVAGTWGVITRQGTTQFRLNARLFVGDGVTPTWFADEAKQVTSGRFSKGFAWTEGIWELKVDASMRLGAVLDAGNKLGQRGCAVYSEEAANNIIYGVDGAVLELYACLFGCIAGQFQYLEALYDAVVWNTLFLEELSLGIFVDSDFYDIKFLDTRLSVISGSGNTYDTITAHTTLGFAWYPQAVGITYENIFHRGAAGTYLQDFFAVAGVDVIYLNSESLNWRFVFPANANQTGYRNYTFDLKVIDSAGTGIVGATVNMDDQFGANVFNVVTGAGGDIAQQAVTYRTYQRVAATAGDEDTIVTYSPHTVTIIKAGNATRTIQYTMDRAREEIEKLTEDGTNIYDTILYDATIY